MQHSRGPMGWALIAQISSSSLPRPSATKPVNKPRGFPGQPKANEERRAKSVARIGHASVEQKLERIRRANQQISFVQLSDALVYKKAQKKLLLKSKLQDELSGSMLIHEVVNQKIRTWFTHDFDGNTTVFQHKLYRLHPIIKKTVSLEAFCTILK